MTQQRLNQSMVFHIHQERTGALDLNSIAKFKKFHLKNVWTILKFTYMLIMNFIKSLKIKITLISV